MPAPLSKKFTVNDLRAARETGMKVPMLTCYDFTTAKLMQSAGVPALLVGDSAGNVMLGHGTTLPVTLDYMIEITAAVRRGAPLAFLVADMPFGSYQGSTARAVKSVTRMVQQTGCDCVKIEAAASQLRAVRELSDAGVAVMAHLGLRPQAVGVLGGYKVQGRTADEADAIVALALRMQLAGAAALLLEAVPPPVARAVIEATTLPVIGCGAGPDCHGHVVVTHDILGLSDCPPKFAPRLADVAAAMTAGFSQYVQRVQNGSYPAPEHVYEMTPAEQQKFAPEMEKTPEKLKRAEPIPAATRP